MRTQHYFSFPALLNAALCVGCCSLLIQPAVATAQGEAAAKTADPWSGKRVMVIRWTTELKVKGKTVARSQLGDVLDVAQSSGDWLWIKQKKGWLNKNDVVESRNALSHFNAQIETNPTAEAYHQRGLVYSQMRQPKKALADFDAAIARDANDVGVYNDRGNIHRKQGNLDKAMADFNAVVQRGVKHAVVFTNIGLVWHDQGNFDKAIASFDSAIQLDPKFSPAYEARGSSHQSQHDYAKAIADFKTAIQLAPNFDRAYNNLAWIQATCRDERFRNGAQAVANATKVCELTEFNDAGYLDTLAAALAEAGQFEEAVKRATESVKLSDGSSRESITKRLELYKAKTPYRDNAE